VAITVREAVQADAQALAQLHVATWQAAYRGILPAELLDGLSVGLREDFWQGLLAGGGDETTLTLVAEEDADAVVGFCSLALPSRDEDAGEPRWPRPTSTRPAGALARGECCSTRPSNAWARASGTM
jgi:hypothetical protein